MPSNTSSTEKLSETEMITSVFNGPDEFRYTTGSIPAGDQHQLVKPVSTVTSPHRHNYLRR
jgi:hypothetical protein